LSPARLVDLAKRYPTVARPAHESINVRLVNDKDRLNARVDLHLHSHASNVTNYYAANALSIPESYSDPLELYRVLKERGMSLVTLTDHNSIDGVKLLLDRGLPDVFISAEMTTTFPEDGCNVHVTIANVNERQFLEANRLRSNIYEMVAYLDREIAAEAARIRPNLVTYFMTHPLMSTENRAYGREGSLSLGHFEKMLLLVPGFEVRNGSRTRALNQTTRAAIERLTPARIDEYANRHDLAPKGATPWRKFVTGGSDDHAGINPGRTFTEFRTDGVTPTPNALVEKLRRGEAEPGGAFGGPITLAHAMLKLVYDGSRRSSAPPGGASSPSTGRGADSGDERSLEGWLREHFPGGHRVVAASPVVRGGLRRIAWGPRPERRAVKLSGALTQLLDLVFGPESRTAGDELRLRLRAAYHRIARLRGPRLGLSFEDLVESEIYGLLSEEDFVASLRAPSQTTDQRIFLVVNALTNRVFARYVENLRRARAANVVDSIRELVALATSHVMVCAPYVAAYQAQSRDARVALDVRAAFGLESTSRLALFTDTYVEVNGVSATIKRVIRESIRRGVDFAVVTCLSEEERAVAMRDEETRRFVRLERLKIFVSVTELGFPEYDGLKIRFPPVLEVLRFLQEGGFTKVHVSTPATVGIVGLVAAKILEIETAATYHTSVPEYVENYTRDVALEDLAWKYMLLFYHAVDEVLVPSRFIAKLLHKRGLRNRKLLILDRWVDTERFRPDARTEGFYERFGVPNDPETVKFLHLGRVGVEKNLALLAAAFRRLHASHRNVHLVVLGDGPFRAELERLVEGLPVTFTGFLQGEDLVRGIASCDVKVFPSVTDTWGNAPLEAQACGLPVIVSEVGGPSELMEPGVTGLKVNGRSEDELARAMERLMSPALRARMGEAARAFAVAHRVDEPFTAILDSQRYRRRIAEAKLEGAARARVPMTTQVLDLTSSRFEALLEAGQSEVVA
jgi:glycosyltransferase involved in cell wall biosynthesis